MPPSISSIYAKCSQRGECRLWKGATSERGYPTIYLPDLYAKSGGKRNGNTSARSVAWRAVHGEVPEGHRMVVTCEHRLCLFVGHMQPMTRLDAQRFAAARGAYSSTRCRIARTATARKNGKLDHSQAQMIRDRVAAAPASESSRVRKELAAELNLARSTVDQIVRGKRWAKWLAPNASVFTMAQAA
jgi:hypothetical protein